MKTNATNIQKPIVKEQPKVNPQIPAEPERVKEESVPTVAPVFEQRNRDKKKYKNYNNIYTKKEEPKEE